MDFYQKQKEPEISFCDVCNISITYKGKGRRRLSCSVKCKNKHDVNLKISKNNYYKDKTAIKCNSCHIEFWTAFEKQRFCSKSCRTKKKSATQSHVYFHKCDDCQSVFATSRHLSGVSAPIITRCKDCQIERRRIRDRKKTLIRQKSISNPRISVALIAKRDCYLCHLCNQIVDMDIKRTDKMGATIDHIVPLSKGGLDNMENVALAHWICNIKKGNRT